MLINKRSFFSIQCIHFLASHACMRVYCISVPRKMHFSVLNDVRIHPGNQQSQYVVFWGEKFFFSFRFVSFAFLTHRVWHLCVFFMTIVCFMCVRVYFFFWSKRSHTSSTVDLSFILNLYHSPCQNMCELKRNGRKQCEMKRGKMKQRQTACRHNKAHDMESIYIQMFMTWLISMKSTHIFIREK